MKIIHSCTPKMLNNLKLIYQDKRMDSLLFNFRARNYFFSLSDLEKNIWKKHCKNVLNNDYFKEYQNNLMFLLKKNKNNQNKILLDKLFSYFQYVLNM